MIIQAAPSAWGQAREGESRRTRVTSRCRSAPFLNRVILQAMTSPISSAMFAVEGLTVLLEAFATASVRLGRYAPSMPRRTWRFKRRWHGGAAIGHSG
jgi:hypothetical protein